MKNVLIFIGLILCSRSTYAQYQVNISLTHPKDSILYFRLASFDEKLFIPKDTIKLKNNKAKIQSKTAVFGGIYTVFLPKSGKKIQLCLENKDIVNLNINDDLPIDSIQTNDPDNRIFLAYQSLEQSFQYLDSQYAEMQKKGIATLKGKALFYKPKIEALVSFRKKALPRLDPKGYVYKYFNILNRIDSYTPSRTDYAGRKAFIDQFNLKDPPLYFSPAPKMILYSYLSSYPLQADSVLTCIEEIMHKIDCKDKIYPNTFNYFLGILQNSSIKNNLKSYVAFVEKYLINNSCTFLPSRKKEEFLASYTKFKALANTDTVTNIVLKDTSGVEQRLLDHLPEYDFTVISFFDPTCEHCKYQMPELNSTLKGLRSTTGLKILHFAVCNTGTFLMNEWKSFIRDKELTEDYVHVMLGDNESVRNQYAAYGNPMFFLCDKNGNIVLKKASISSIKNYLARMKKS